MSTSRRFVAALVSVAHILISSMFVLPSGAHAQVSDGEPPAIQFERIAEGVRGDTQVFSATITDDVGIAAVTLHYRLGDAEQYNSLAMEPLIGTDIFTASVDTAGTEETVLQYYIEARDEAGNRSIQGFAFDPIERSLVDRPSTLAGAPEVVEQIAEPQAAPPKASGTSTGRKVLYGVLGVLAVGAIAAAVGGGGDGGSDNPRSDDPQVPLDIVVDPL